MTDDEKRIVEWLDGFADSIEENITNLGSVESAMSMGGVAFLRKASDAIRNGDHRKD